jgi:hypothetical protein
MKIYPPTPSGTQPPLKHNTTRPKFNTLLSKVKVDGQRSSANAIGNSRAGGVRLILGTTESAAATCCRLARLVHFCEELYGGIVLEGKVVK